MRSATCEPIGYLVSNPTSAGLYRFHGDAVVDGSVRPWSLVLKALRPWSEDALARFAPADPARFLEANRWDREVDAYASGALARLGGGIRAPRLLGLERTDEGAWLWLEDVREDMPVWDVGRYALAARQLGAFNASSAGTSPAWPWLSHRWIRSRVERASPWSWAMLDRPVWGHEEIRAALGDGARPLLRGIVARDEERLAVLEGLTHCVAHLDAYRGNLLASGGETVVLDWSFVGMAALGAEASHLVCASVFYSLEPVDVDELSDAVLDAYLAGLRDGGWRGGADEVRTGFFASTLLRWATIGLGAVSGADDPAARAAVTARTGLPFERWLALMARRIAYLRRCDTALDAIARAV